jgi:hypothetical protein
MLTDASSEGVEVNSRIGLRDLDGQWRVWHNNGHPDKASFVAKPGTSNHGTGRAIDFETGFDWLLANAGRYGWVNLPSERWHYDHVSTPGIIKKYRIMAESKSTKRKQIMGGEKKKLTNEEKTALASQYDEATAKYEALPYNQARNYSPQTWMQIQVAIGMNEKERTGMVDEATCQAVIVWQRSLRIFADGKVGAATLKALDVEATKQKNGEPAAPAHVPVTTDLPSSDELTARLARSIGIWETNRGNDNPSPRESSLDTVAGIHASMATIEQATMPSAITAIKRDASLRNKADPPLTIGELNQAEARCVAVVTLLRAVDEAVTKGTNVDDFIKNGTTIITASGLSNDDVKTMFSAVTLKSTIDAAHTRVEGETSEADKKKMLSQETAAISAANRLGMGEGSVKSYIRKPTNWGENRAAWQRKAVNDMPDNVGIRVERVSVANEGAALAIPVIKGRINVELAKNPIQSEKDIIKTVAQKNNPNEANYGTHVWETYQRLYSKGK